MAHDGHSIMGEPPASGEVSDVAFQPRVTTRQSVFGVMRTWSALNPKEIGFLFVTTLSLVLTLVLAIYKLATLSKDNKEDLVFAIILLINCCFSFYYIYHGVLWERPYEIVVNVLAMAVVCCYLVINFVQTVGWTDNVKIARLVAAAFLAPFTVVLGIILSKQYNESGNLVFRTVGAREDLQTACRLLFITEALLKFDFQLEASMLVLIFNGRLDMDLRNIVTLTAGVPFAVGWMLFGMLVLRMESKLGCYAFLFTSLFEPAYVIYIIADAINLMNDGSNMTLQGPDPINAVISVTFAVSAIALIMRLMLIICTVLVMRNFGVGLKPKLTPSCLRNPERVPLLSEDYPYSQHF